ncbi:VWA domain-containing protein [Pedobacter sp. MR2016-19]|uniref:vWA domain-containing protein n=1 Tax=Pedobacter sp. MR2016-19 TaxID=2780089 RepID=UPI0018774A25|nr:vWA domain-containing protein [Pedobacter sp. MR2016-19]MBE5322025.1 VWA domain-containing protein [Pedobacter sp. MR2016-19]
MDALLYSLSDYWSNAKFSEILFWVFPFSTFLGIYVLTLILCKLFPVSSPVLTVFSIYRAWIIASMCASLIIVSLISVWWAINFFSSNPWQMSLLLSLILSLSSAAIALLSLKTRFKKNRSNEILEIPATLGKREANFLYVGKRFRKLKIYWLLPLSGFLFLLAGLTKGQNLISIIYDNSASMVQTNAQSALAETFAKLDVRNQITLTTLEGLDAPDDPQAKTSVTQLINMTDPSALKAGKVMFFENPRAAEEGLAQISNACMGSPILESVWKTFLYTSKDRETFDNKIMIVITDGLDNMDEKLLTGPFVFEFEEFQNAYPPDKLFVINYGQEGQSNLIKKFELAGCEVTVAGNNKQNYLEALDNALGSFKSDLNILYWTLLTVLIFSVAGIMINPPNKM